MKYKTCAILGFCAVTHTYFDTVYIYIYISPCNEYSGLISCRIGLSDLLAVQGTLKSLLQHHNLKASMLKLKL